MLSGWRPLGEATGLPPVGESYGMNGYFDVTLPTLDVAIEIEQVLDEIG